MKEKKYYPIENEECYTFADYLRLRGLKFTHIPNETYTPHWGVKMRNKRLGVESGVPDYLIFIPKKNILLFIEMKRQNSSPSQTKQSQKDWLEALNQVSGVLAVVCRGAQEAIDLVEKSLK